MALLGGLLVPLEGGLIVLIDANPRVVRRLSDLAEECRRDLGDAAQNVDGENCRPVGRVANPRTLTTLDTDDPLVAAEYD